MNDADRRISTHAETLFDVEHETTIPYVRNLTVGPVAPRDVHEFARRYHYAVTGGNMSWRWGLWLGPVLYGVVAYNLPTRGACESVFGPEHYDKVWHMGRLICANKAPSNSESRLIGGSLRAIEREYPHVWAVLTYAATSQGHIGYVYQATNALYVGQAERSHYYLDQKGQRRAPKQGRNVRMSLAIARGWTVQREGPKHRYVYILGNKTERKQRRAQLKLTIEPYPKIGTVRDTLS